MAMTKKKWKKFFRKPIALRALGGDDPMQIKTRKIAHILECAEDGEVAILSSGMDCDCSAWSNRLVAVVPANYYAVKRIIDEEDENAEGPISVWVEKPSVALEAEYGQRDLALEAFENGHPHSVHY